MLIVPPQDDTLQTLERQTIASSMHPGVTFRIDRVLGIGGVSVAFFALRVTPDGSAPVVLKVIRPRVMVEAGRTAELSVKKEAVALGRLNERVPPTPFVVRLIEAGSLVVGRPGGGTLELPWLAIEWVHGGAEGTTLDERVRHAVERTGLAFDPARVAHAIECLGAGLDAIHEVGVIHRDITPGNVLCCGFGDEEIFKIADFGIARPTGVMATFGGIALGTPGYASPEQILSDDKLTAPTSDVFSLGALVFHMLTGEDYFPATTPVEAVLAAQQPGRRSIAESTRLSPELRARPTACSAIDAVLARATASHPQFRPPSGGTLGAMLVPLLRPEPVRPRTAQRRIESLAGARAPSVQGGWVWTVRSNPGADRVIRSVAWDGDGTCLAATDQGLAFWNGTGWQAAPLHGLERGSARLVRRIGPGAWLVGGDGATLALYSTEGIARVLHGPDADVSFEQASGDLSDLAVIVGTRPGETPVLYALAGRHWLKPAALAKAASIAALARLEDERWLVAGRALDGDGFAAIYSPLYWDVERVATPAARVYLGCAAQPDLSLGVVVGTGGHAVRITGNRTTASRIEGEPDLTSAAVDVAGCAWAASLGRLWTLERDAMSWMPAWHDQRWRVPIVSLFADVGLVIAMGADGGIVEGRSLA